MSLHDHFSANHYRARSNGPFSWLNPTIRYFSLENKAPATHSPESEIGEDEVNGAKPSEDEVKTAHVEQKWSSRDNRKGA